MRNELVEILNNNHGGGRTQWETVNSEEISPQQVERYSKHGIAQFSVDDPRDSTPLIVIIDLQQLRKIKPPVAITLSCKRYNVTATISSDKQPSSKQAVEINPNKVLEGAYLDIRFRANPNAQIPYYADITPIYNRFIYFWS